MPNRRIIAKPIVATLTESVAGRPTRELANRTPSCESSRPGLRLMAHFAPAVALCLGLAGPINAQGGDSCATAQDVAGSTSWSFDNTSATTGPDPGCFYPSFEDVWFHWTPPLSGDYRIQLAGIDDALVGIFDGGDCSTSNLVECEPDPNEMDPIELRDVVAGDSRLIVIGSLALGLGGVGTLNTIHRGERFCTSTVNSTGFAALIRMIDTASSSIVANDFGLLASFVPVGQPGIFFYGPTALAPMTLGDGLRCVGGPPGTVRRIHPGSIGAPPHGTMFALLDNTDPQHSQITPGATLSFQCWFRDPAAGMSGVNLSEGLKVTFTP